MLGFRVKENDAEWGNLPDLETSNLEVEIRDIISTLSIRDSNDRGDLWAKLQLPLVWLIMQILAVYDRIINIEKSGHLFLTSNNMIKQTSGLHLKYICKVRN